VDGASELFGPSPRAIRSMVARRQVPFRKLNGRVVFIKTELEEFVQSLPGVSLEEIRKKQTA